ncbi:MAG: hypothetical protein Fur0018_05100 [Anaerolineales bacterium]
MKLKAPLATILALSVGIITLSGYFTTNPTIQTLQVIFLQWAIWLAAIALLVGITNLLGVHFHRLSSGEKGGLYSMVLILALAGTFALGTYDYILHTWGDASQSWLQWIFDYVQYPIQVSLMALLAVALVYAAIRMVRNRHTLATTVFLLTAVLVLAGSVPFFGTSIPVLSDALTPWVTHVLALAGARGILLGMALGAIATGLRVLAGADRPYGG